MQIQPKNQSRRFAAPHRESADKAYAEQRHSERFGRREAPLPAVRDQLGGLRASLVEGILDGHVIRFGIEFYVEKIRPGLVDCKEGPKAAGVIAKLRIAVGA